jgi:carboxymethylenebutenolidase
MDEHARRQAIALYDRCTHEGMDRRLFMRRMTALAGSVAAAEALVASISANPAAAAVVPADDKRLATRTMTFSEPAGYKAYVAEPRTRSQKATILVIHENRGLNEHIRDIARRLALAGYRAVAADFLSPTGGTPENEDAARQAIGQLDLAASTAAGVAMLRELAKTSRRGKVGAVGFCWGGAFVNRLAIAGGTDLDAGVVYYGPGPSPTEAAAVQSPLLIHHAGLDSRVAQTLWPWVSALQSARKPVSYFNYEGANHAFNNDTSAERYDKRAADLAWGRTLRFFRRHLA